MRLRKLLFSSKPVFQLAQRDFASDGASGVVTYCAVDTGIVLTAMTPGELLPNLRLQFEQLRQRLGEPVLILGCDCFLRRMESELRGEDKRMSDFLAANRVIGFNTYGEQFNGMHINQTFTGVAFAFPR